ncbi:hypothetical protein C5H21_12775 [Xylella fastidiosa]|nr:hypothetical protein C5H21_12775 [Xylella fastidiosa]
MQRRLSLYSGSGSRNGALSIIQSFNHSIIQSFNHSIIQSFNHSIIQSFNVAMFCTKYATFHRVIDEEIR